MKEPKTQISHALKLLKTRYSSWFQDFSLSWFPDALGFIKHNCFIDMRGSQRPFPTSSEI